MYEDYPPFMGMSGGLPGYGMQHHYIDPYHPLVGGQNSMLNPAAFDDANMDDYLGSDFEGFIKGWNQYAMMHPGAHGPPPPHNHPYNRGGKGSGSGGKGSGRGRGSSSTTSTGSTTNSR